MALGARLEQMEASLDQVIRDEGHTVSTEIRYTLSELGRRLALDLPQTLERHRQMIVAELRPAGPDGGAVDATAPPDAATAGDAPADAIAGQEDADIGEAGTDGDTDDTAEEEGDAESESDSTESSNAGGRRKRRRRRGEG